MIAIPGLAVEPALERLAEAMVRAAGHSTDNFAIDAGYTYFGQFVDHDVTLDATTPRVPGSPLLDLDSLYGLGPRPGSPLYGHGPEPLHGARLRLGGRRDTELALAREDLPRDDAGHALIGDKRNDENLIVSQLHLLFIRFHNRMVEQVATPGMPVIRVFQEARRLVCWHYQWLIVNDFLPKVAGSPAVQAALAGELAVKAVGRDFASAAYRFGHSMVREDYKLNDGPSVPLFRTRGSNPDPARTLAGGRRLPADLVIDWKHFFRIGDHSPQRSKLIDASLSTEFDEMLGMKDTSLALLDLLQGVEDKLPTGTALTEGTPDALKAEELLGRLGELDDDTRGLVVERTPLWYFVLCEAEARGDNGKRLGPVGARIVAEQLIGLLYADDESYLVRDPDWRPAFSSLAGFVSFALGD